MYGYDKCLMLLLARGAEYTASDMNDFTPIEFAVMFGHDDCVRVLMERGIQQPVLEQLPPVFPAQKVSYLE
jgi:ankyrin repeat protein